MVLAVLSAVGCEHEGQNTYQAQRYSTDAGEDQKHCSVFKAHEVDHEAQDHIDDIAPKQNLELIQLLQNGGHQHSGDDTGDHTQHVQQDGIQLAAKEEEGNE